MKQFKTSIAAWSLAVALASFAVLYNLLPYERMSDLSIAVAFGFMLAVTFRYSLDGLRALRTGRRAGEFIIVAVFVTYLVLSVRQGWVWYVQANTLPNGQRPDWLINTVVSVFLPWMGAWAAFCALFAPDIGTSSMVTRPSVLRSAALFIAGAASGFVLASSFRMPAPSQSMLMGGRVVCSEHVAVWGSSTGIYHTATSPYRGMVRPGWCFDTIEDAEAAGFWAPKR